jgi:CRP-like cAMP-binding protein
VATLLDAQRFRRFVEERGLGLDLMRQALARLRESDQQRTELQTLPVATRLARSLLRLAALTRQDDSPTVTPLRLSGLTQEEIAQSVGVTRNAVIPGPRQLRETGAISTSRRAIVIRDLAELRRWAAQA